MKQTYVRPMMYIEQFVSDNAVATGNCGAKDIVFDCMMGQNTDTTNVLLAESGCKNVAGMTTLTIAEHGAHNGSDRNWNSHSNGSDGTWTKGTAGWIYTAPEGAQGLLYICASGGGGGHHGNQSSSTFTTSQWTTSGDRIKHAASHTGQWHCQIAPIYNVSTVQAGS